MKSVVVALAVLSAVAGCGSDARTDDVSSRCSALGWAPAQTTDATLNFCVPTDYRRVRQTALWTRVSGDSAPQFVGPEWISVVHIRDSVAHADPGPWPPSLLRDTSWSCADCYDVTDYAVRWESVGDRIVRVETARATGGFAGDRDRPTLRAAWPTSKGDWVFVQGQAPTPDRLDELRRILRTVHVHRRARSAG